MLEHPRSGKTFRRTEPDAPYHASRSNILNEIDFFSGPIVAQRL